MVSSCGSQASAGESRPSDKNFASIALFVGPSTLTQGANLAGKVGSAWLSEGFISTAYQLKAWKLTKRISSWHADGTALLTEQGAARTQAAASFFGSTLGVLTTALTILGYAKVSLSIDGILAISALYRRSTREKEENLEQLFKKIYSQTQAVLFTAPNPQNREVLLAMDLLPSAKNEGDIYEIILGICDSIEFDEKKLADLLTACQQLTRAKEKQTEKVCRALDRQVELLTNKHKKLEIELAPIKNRKGVQIGIVRRKIELGLGAIQQRLTEINEIKALTLASIEIDDTNYKARAIDLISITDVVKWQRIAQMLIDKKFD